MQELSFLESKFRGNELTKLNLSYEQIGDEAMHHENYMGAQIDILRIKLCDGRKSYALRITLDGQEFSFIQSSEEISKDDSLAHAAWLLNHRYLPIMVIGLKARDELHPADKNEFLHFTNVLNCHYICGEASLAQLDACLHYMIDSMASRNVLKEGEEKSLRDGVEKFVQEMKVRQDSQDLHPSLFHERDKIQQAGHAVAIVPGAQLGVATQQAVERVMLNAAHNYLTKFAKRFQDTL